MTVRGLPAWTDTGESADMQEAEIPSQEQALRDWFTQDADPILRQVDGLDIGWGGVQRWATARMPPLTGEAHLDFACGYGTFLAQLGWRFPASTLIGLNIEKLGPRYLIARLLARAKVSAALVQADARRMPFRARSFASASCFLGLQDIEIGFGLAGVRETLSEAARILRPGGSLILLDEYPSEKFRNLLDGLPVAVTDESERALDVRWERPVAERAIAMYADGWVAQSRETDRERQEQVRSQALRRMRAELERQLATRGYYVPFGAIQMVVARKRA
jgi:ubiquinone/menaquinone biosynthesis C-methylase UbiE